MCDGPSRRPFQTSSASLCPSVFETAETVVLSSRSSSIPYSMASKPSPWQERVSSTAERRSRSAIAFGLRHEDPDRRDEEQPSTRLLDRWRERRGQDAGSSSPRCAVRPSGVWHRRRDAGSCSPHACEGEPGARRLLGDGHGRAMARPFPRGHAGETQRLGLPVLHIGVRRRNLRSGARSRPLRAAEVIA